MSTSSKEVSNYILGFQNIENNLYISHLKLQKLLYYSQAYHLAITDTALFTEDIVAWKYGPVELTVYEVYKKYKSELIPPAEDAKTACSQSAISANSIKVITQVMDAYGQLSAIGLMERTHREAPWKDAYSKGEGTVIPKEVLQRYYKKFLIYR